MKDVLHEVDVCVIGGGMAGVCAALAAARHGAKVMPKAFRLEGRSGEHWQTLAKIENNYQRLVRVPIHRALSALRFTLDVTWGPNRTNLYAFYVD